MITQICSRMMPMELSRRLILSGALALTGGTATSMPRRKQLTVAFNYAERSTVTDLNYLAKFDLLVTGSILSSDQLQTVRPHGVKLVVYLWSSAFYLGEGIASEAAWQALISNNPGWLLSANPVGGAAASEGKLAFWYDFGEPAFRAAFAQFVSGVISKNDYQGVFLDTLGSDSIPPLLKAEFEKRHPGTNYDQEQAQFLSLLREALGSEGIIFTNQGYRKAELFLQHSDFDLIENSCTLIGADGATKFRPWRDAKNEWESIAVPMNELIMPAAKSHPNTQFVHINYAAGGPEIQQRAVAYGYACAKLWNHVSFAAPPGVQKPIHSDIYFTNLGEPLTVSYDEDRANGAAWRQFQNGIVALNCSDRPYRIRRFDLRLADPHSGYVFRKAMPP
jgi:Hypothetical glycosyl hydrolase family 15